MQTTETRRAAMTKSVDDWDIAETVEAGKNSHLVDYRTVEVANPALHATAYLQRSGNNQLLPGNRSLVFCPDYGWYELGDVPSRRVKDSTACCAECRRNNGQW